MNLEEASPTLVMNKLYKMGFSNPKAGYLDNKRAYCLLM